VIVGIVVGIIALLIGIGIVLFIIFIKRRKKQKNEKKRKNEQQQLNETNSMIQQEQKKRETVVLESETNTITSFDETNPNTTTLSTYQPGNRSAQNNK
jgi:FtsZ-interacting cell division protein ZipA